MYDFEIPDIDHRGNGRNKEVVFFKTPERIGEIISAESDLDKGSNAKAKSGTQLFLFYIKFIAFLLAIPLLIIIFGNLDQTGIALILIIPFIIALLLAYFNSRFYGTCSYIGENGFALYEFKNSIDNIIKNIEISFDDVTDLTKYTVDVRENYSYGHTKFGYLWVSNNKVLYDFEGIYDNKKRKPDEYTPEYYFMNAAGKNWNKVLYARMDDDIEEKGYIEFNLIGYEDKILERIPFLRVYHGKIDLISEAESYKSLKREDIKRVYLQNGQLIIEDVNFKKGLFKNKGGQHAIQLSSISNVDSFFVVLEKLMGYSFNS